MNLYEFYEKNDVSMPGLDWLGDRTPSQFWKDCERPDWFLWGLLPALSEEQKRCAFIAADLACRKYAPYALAVFGLHDLADALRTMPAITDAETAIVCSVQVDEAVELAIESLRLGSSKRTKWTDVAWNSAVWAICSARCAMECAAPRSPKEAVWKAGMAAMFMRMSCTGVDISVLPKAAAERQAAADAELMARFREVITLDKFIAACEAVGIETAGNARCAKSP